MLHLPVHCPRSRQLPSPTVKSIVVEVWMSSVLFRCSCVDRCLKCSVLVEYFIIRQRWCRSRVLSRFTKSLFQPIRDDLGSIVVLFTARQRLVYVYSGLSIKQASVILQFRNIHQIVLVVLVVFRLAYFSRSNLSFWSCVLKGVLWRFVITFRRIWLLLSGFAA